MNEPVESKRSRPWLWWVLGGAAVLIVCCVGVLAVGGALMMFGNYRAANVFNLGNNTPTPEILATPTSSVEATQPTSSLYPQAKGNAMGDPNAPVKIVEYADYQCPFCARFEQMTQQQLIENYIATGKVYFEFRSMGEFIGPESKRAAEAAYCAGDQGQFWEYHDMLFSNQGSENSGAFSDDHLQAFAGNLGLDMNQFNTCLSSGKYSSRVDQDGTDGQAAGVQGTPSFVINGQLAIRGAQPYDAFASAIDALLK